MKTRFLTALSSFVAPWMLVTDLHTLDFTHFGPESWAVMPRVLADILLMYLAGRSLKEDGLIWEPSPAQSIAGVIVLTGLAAATIDFTITDGASLTAPAIIAALTIIGSLIVYRIAAKHTLQIGEARFRTPPEGS